MRSNRNGNSGNIWTVRPIAHSLKSWVLSRFSAKSRHSPIRVFSLTQECGEVYLTDSYNTAKQNRKKPSQMIEKSEVKWQKSSTYIISSILAFGMHFFLSKIYEWCNLLRYNTIMAHNLIAKTNFQFNLENKIRSDHTS